MTAIWIVCGLKRKERLSSYAEMGAYPKNKNPAFGAGLLCYL